MPLLQVERNNYAVCENVKLSFLRQETTPAALCGLTAIQVVEVELTVGMRVLDPLIVNVERDNGGILEQY